MSYLSDDTEQDDDKQDHNITACSEVLQVNVAANVSFYTSLLCHSTNLQDKSFIYAVYHTVQQNTTSYDTLQSQGNCQTAQLYGGVWMEHIIDVQSGMEGKFS